MKTIQFLQRNSCLILKKYGMWILVCGFLETFLMYCSCWISMIYTADNESLFPLFCIIMQWNLCHAIFDRNGTWKFLQLWSLLEKPMYKIYYAVKNIDKVDSKSYMISKSLTNWNWFKEHNLFFALVHNVKSIADFTWFIVIIS